MNDVLSLVISSITNSKAKYLKIKSLPKELSPIQPYNHLPLNHCCSQEINVEPKKLPLVLNSRRGLDAGPKRGGAGLWAITKINYECCEFLCPQAVILLRCAEKYKAFLELCPLSFWMCWEEIILFRGEFKVLARFCLVVHKLALNFSIWSFSFVNRSGFFFPCKKIFASHYSLACVRINIESLYLWYRRNPILQTPYTNNPRPDQIYSTYYFF